jgi:hypothetical protein
MKKGAGTTPTPSCQQKRFPYGTMHTPKGAYAPNPKPLHSPAAIRTRAQQAAQRLALRQAHDDWQTCLSFASWLEGFQVGMLHAHAPWTTKQYDAIHNAELTLCTAMADTIARLSQLQEGASNV